MSGPDPCLSPLEPARLLAKLGARDRVQLVITAYQVACSTRKAAKQAT